MFATGAERIAYVIASGECSPHMPDMPPDTYVIAADGGLAHALSRGLIVHELVGDLDSATDADVASVEAAGTQVVRHPAAKNETDLELALRSAVARNPKKIIVTGVSGGRLDHFLGNIFLLAHPDFAPTPIVAYLPDAVVTVVWGGQGAVTLQGQPGGVVSLLPAHGDAWRVRTEGLLYPLRSETLDAGSTRGVSNEFLGEAVVGESVLSESAVVFASVSLERGALLAVVPT